VAGGPQPGFSFSDAHEVLELGTAEHPGSD
jgi:hypothetical protein